MRNVTICLFAKAGFMLVQSGNNRDRAIQLKNFAKHLIVRLKSNIVKVNEGGVEWDIIFLTSLNST